MLTDRTERVIRAFEKYVDARIEYELSIRDAHHGHRPMPSEELARKQHASDVALVEVGIQLDGGPGDIGPSGPRGE